MPRSAGSFARPTDGCLCCYLVSTASDFRTGVERLRQLAVDADRDPASLPIHGRVYLGDGWQKQVDEALEVGVADLSIGFNRMANRGSPTREHLDAVLAAKPELDRLVGRS